MKKQFLTFLLAVGIPFLAISQVEKNMGDFTSLKTANRIKVELIPANANKVIIIENQTDIVKISNNNGRLVLKNNLKNSVTENEYLATVQVYFNNLEEIDAQGGSYIFSNQIINQKELELNASLGSVIKLDIQSNNVIASANTGARIELNGVANESIKLSGSSGAQITANNLSTLKTYVKVNSGSIVKAFATAFLEAKVLAGGSIKIYGNPKEVNEKITLGGNIEYIK